MYALIIEDNPDIVANLFGFLEPQGFTLDVAYSGNAGLELARNTNYDVIVLDLELPGLDGVEVCRKLRKEARKATPVLMLTARDTVKDKLVGFDVGADDYLVKPFSLVELEARLRALVRRARNESVEHILEFGDLQFDLSRCEAKRAGRVLALTPTGYKLLEALMRTAPAIITRDALLREIWGDDPPDSDALRTHIHALRTAMDRPFVKPMLVTLPGNGYKLVHDET
ncbi:MAG: response regulator transcription factor [Oxalicibacterium faecigallinarum]|uniref:response regulator transcription factor n=1 Tax=Oxalicibacterium faecigallinarum TaxID=573741 RepID=UPI00280A1752|nr:response regulator transcription factor [Oxalicibacterium faecigallinarum]MDQ7968837.1 response regulator transcription factor [Oxalicibacterium faecigallinarum]